MSWRWNPGGPSQAVHKPVVPPAPAVGKNDVSAENVLTELECEPSSACRERRKALEEKKLKATETLRQRDLENQKNIKSDDVDSDKDDTDSWAAAQRKSSTPASYKQYMGKQVATSKVSFSSGQPTKLFCTKSGAMPKAVRPHLCLFCRISNPYRTRHRVRMSWNASPTSNKTVWF